MFYSFHAYGNSFVFKVSATLTAEIPMAKTHLSMNFCSKRWCIIYNIGRGENYACRNIICINGQRDVFHKILRIVNREIGSASAMLDVMIAISSLVLPISLDNPNIQYSKSGLSVYQNTFMFEPERVTLTRDRLLVSHRGMARECRLDDEDSVHAEIFKAIGISHDIDSFLAVMNIHYNSVLSLV